MSDAFESHSASLTSPAEKHSALSANPGADISPRPRAVWCEAAGTITLTDENGTALPYTMTTGQILPFRPMRCTGISGGTFYGIS